MEDRFAVCAGRIFAFALVALFLLTTTSVAQPNVQGQWTTLPYAMPINPVHVALLHTGKVLVVAGSGNCARLDRPSPRVSQLAQSVRRTGPLTIRAPPLRSEYEFIHSIQPLLGHVL